MNLAYTVPCPYCGADRHEKCRHTMLPGRPIQGEPHQARIDYAEGTPF